MLSSRPLLLQPGPLSTYRQTGVEPHSIYPSEAPHPQDKTSPFTTDSASSISSGQRHLTFCRRCPQPHPLGSSLASLVSSAFVGVEAPLDSELLECRGGLAQVFAHNECFIGVCGMSEEFNLHLRLLPSVADQPSSFLYLAPTMCLLEGQVLLRGAPACSLCVVCSKCWASVLSLVLPSWVRPCV